MLNCTRYLEETFKGLGLYLKMKKEKLKDPNYKPSWRREQIVEQAQETYDKESKRILELDNNEDVRKATQVLDELRRGYNALKDRDKGAITQLLKEVRRRTPELMESVIFVGMNDIAKQFDYLPRRSLNSRGGRHIYELP